MTTRQRGPEAPCAVPTTDLHTTRALDEVHVRLEAMTTNSSYALLGELDPISVLEGNVRCGEHAALHLRVAMEPVSRAPRC
jgi:hypothetical protein